MTFTALFKLWRGMMFLLVLLLMLLSLSLPLPHRKKINTKEYGQEGVQ